MYMCNQPGKKQHPMPRHMYTRKMSNNSQKRSRIYLAFANQNLISRIMEMRHTWNNQGILDQAMVSISEDFEAIFEVKNYSNVPPNSTLMIATTASAFGCDGYCLI